MPQTTLTQLPLGLSLRDDAIFENYFVADNRQLIEVLTAFIAGQSESFLYCYGDAGVGKTHLLQACCHAGSEQQKILFYLPLKNYEELTPAVFDGMEAQHLICLDDVDAIVGNAMWEEALFHFYNRVRDRGALLLMSAKIAPQQLSCVLPDLQSRLRSALVLPIKNLADHEKIEALKMRAKLRGFDLPDEVASYLIRHYPRDMQGLFAVMELLDKASLAAKRKLTIPFVKSVMQQ